MADNENLYVNIKNIICDQIFEGQYEDGDRMPSERELSETFGISRVTLRKSMELLEEDHLVVREVGRGTRISLRNGGNVSDLDMIVLIAPAKNPFFSKFIAHFQEYVEQKKSLLLYVEKPKKEELEDCLYRLYKRGLRNVVVWLEDLPVNQDKLMRLRAIGMNMVFFDSNQGLPFGDCVAVDNKKAIAGLVKSLKEQGAERIGYVGWDARHIYSIGEREEAYVDLVEAEQKPQRCIISWKQKEENKQRLTETLASWKKEGTLPEGIICGDWELGKLLAEVIKDESHQIRMASMDEVVIEGMQVITCRQDLKKTVKQIFTCLNNQRKANSRWKPNLYVIEGILEG